MALLLDGLTGLAETMFGRFHYSAPFVVLFLCGIGLPLPEEVTLIGSGLLVYQGHVDFVPIVAVCSVAILLGDSVPYWLGRRYGDSILRWKWFRRVIRPGRIRLLRSRMTEHGNWVIFTCRFLPGIRVPGYFTAGLLKMSYPRFILLDGLGVLISVPASIYIGNLFGQSIDRLKDEMQNLHLLLALVALSLILIMIVRGRLRARERQERREAALAGLVNTRQESPEVEPSQESGKPDQGPPHRDPESLASGAVTRERLEEGRTGD